MQKEPILLIECGLSKGNGEKNGLGDLIFNE